MPSIKDESTVNKIAEVFCGEGKRNKAETLRIVGYADSYCDNRGTGIVYTNDRVRAAIARIDDKIVAEMDLSRKAQYQRLLDIYENTNSDSVKVACLREMNEMLGFHREKAPNAEKLEELRERMSAEDVEYRKAYAKSRTDAESGPKLAKEA